MPGPMKLLSAQRGVAVVTALLLATLAVTIVASLFWQQQVQVRSIENQRLQLQKVWIMRGALDWASMILRAGARQSSIDDLTQPWATPLAETRLDQYVDDGQSGGNSDAGDAVLSGNITDAQSRYNLNNLSANGVVSPTELAIFQRLLINLRLPVNLGRTIAQGIASSQATVANAANAANAGNGTLPMITSDDLLSLPGFTTEIIRRLSDYVVFLPEVTAVNVNTAPPELLAARFPTLSLAQANSLVARRLSAPFMDVANLSTQMKQLFGQEITDTANVALSSNYFLVYGRVRMGRATLSTTSLIQRINHRTGSNIVWTREN
ncbi:type II secretion system minor pseudopilin GspK [Glaciimonas sp. GG7]